MTEKITFLDDLSDETTDMSTVEIFDPPMCCPTGMCGPTIDQTLLDVNEMILELQSSGVRVVRYQMTSHPHAFLNNAEIMRLVREQQMAALPITTVNGKVVKIGIYPDLAEIKNAFDGVEK